MDERTLFLTALEKTDPAERSAWLREACGGDKALQQRVEALLKTHDDAGSFLEKPPVDCLAPTAVPDVDSSDAVVSLDFLAPSSIPGCLGTLDHYEVLQVVGRGGMGVVLKARDSKLQRIVAIKILAPELAANVTARKRFLREAQAAAAVAHVHVVTIHAIDEQRPYLVMEYIEGQSLKDKIDCTGPLELKEILRIGSQIAAGLAAAHKQGLIHRDIKPANILLENGVQRVKITDFGLARAVDDIAITRTGEVAGTPQYMSPEQAQGHIVDHRSDLFSLGSVLYTMCTGRSPFRADSTIAVIRRVCDDVPRPIRETNADVPDWLCDIIDKLLEKSPPDRFHTSQEVSDLLAQHLAHVQQPLHTAPPAALPAALPRRIASQSNDVQKSLRGAWGRMLGSGLLLIVFVAGAMTVFHPILQWPLPEAWMAAALILGGIACLVVAGRLRGDPTLKSGMEWLAGFALLFGLGELIGTVTPTLTAIVSGTGTLVVHSDDPDVEVALDGKQLDLPRKHALELKLPAGLHTVAFLKRGSPVNQQSVTLTRGDTQVVRWPPSQSTVIVDTATTRELRQLHELARQDLEVVREQHKAGVVGATALTEAEIRVTEAELRLAEAESIWPRQDVLYQRLLEECSTLHQLAQDRFNMGVATAEEVRRAKVQWLEVQQRWNAGRAINGIPPVVPALAESDSRKLDFRSSVVSPTGSSFPDMDSKSAEQPWTDLLKSPEMSDVLKRDPGIRRDQRSLVMSPVGNALGTNFTISNWQHRNVRMRLRARCLVKDVGSQLTIGWMHPGAESPHKVDAVLEATKAGDVVLQLRRAAMVNREDVLHQQPTALRFAADEDIVLELDVVRGAVTARAGDVVLTELQGNDPTRDVYPWISVFRSNWKVLEWQVQDLGANPPPTNLSGMAPSEWKSLFNGRDLDGWLKHPDEPGEWRVEDGAIANGNKPGYLYSVGGDYENFHLRCEVRVNDRGDGGVLFRAPFERGQKFGLIGYEAQICAGKPLVAGWATGAIGTTNPQQGWRLLQFAGTSVTPHEWFPLEIIAQGRRLETFVSGKKIAEYDDIQHQYVRGRIVLQSSGDTTSIAFRNIEIRELLPPPVEPLSTDPPSGTPAPGAAEASAATIDLNGTWDSRFGDVVFMHPPAVGDAPFAVTGHYAIGKGVISGVADPKTRTLHGTFLEANSKGTVQLILAEDNSRITGKYSYSGSTVIRQWDMTKQAPVDESGPTSAAAPTNVP